MAQRRVEVRSRLHQSLARRLLEVVVGDATALVAGGDGAGDAVVDHHDAVEQRPAALVVVGAVRLLQQLAGQLRAAVVAEGREVLEGGDEGVGRRHGRLPRCVGAGVPGVAGRSDGVPRS